MSVNSSIIQLSTLTENDKYVAPYSNADTAQYVESYANLEELNSYVNNPFFLQYSYTFKMATIDEEITDINGSINFNGSGTVNLDEISADFTIGLRADITLPAITASGSYEVAWVENIGDVMFDEARFSTSNIEFETLPWYWDDVYRNFYLPESKQKVYNDIVGQQNLREIVIADPSSPEYVSYDDLLLVNPADSTGVYTGYAATATVTPAFNLIGLAGTMVTGLAADATVPTDGLDTTGTTTTTTGMDTEGARVLGYNGLQTYKTSHAETTVTHKFKFWWCVDPKAALCLAGIQATNTTKVRFNILPYTSLIVEKSGTSPVTALSAVPSISSSHFYSRSVYAEKAVRTAYTSAAIQYLSRMIVSEKQTISSNSSSNIKINPTFIVDEMFFMFQDTRFTDTTSYINKYSRYHSYSTGAIAETWTPPITNLKIRLDSADHTNQAEKFYRSIHPDDVHTRVPTDKFIYNYSFSLAPEDTQPTSYLNCSSAVNIYVTPTLNTPYSGDNSLTLDMLILYITRQFIRYGAGTIGRAFMN